MDVIKYLDDLCSNPELASRHAITYHFTETRRTPASDGSATETTYVISNREGHLRLQTEPPLEFERGSIQFRDLKGNIVYCAYLSDHVSYTVRTMMNRLRRRGHTPITRLTSENILPAR